jgi:hypothetical protein
VAKKKLTLSVDGGLVAKAKELGINISEVAEVALKIRAAEFKGTYAAYQQLPLFRSALGEFFSSFPLLLSSKRPLRLVLFPQSP